MSAWGTDAAGGGVTWKAASGAQRSEAQIGPSGESGVGVNREGWVGDQMSMSSGGGSRKKRKAVVRKGSADTKEYGSCQQNEMEVGGNKSLEVSRAVRDSAGWCEPLRAKYMCDEKCKKDGFKFYHIAAILVDDDGKPRTINLC